MTIEEICRDYEIENYTINGDGYVDVDGDVEIRTYTITKLPIRFGSVTGEFNISHNKLTTLEGCPVKVGGGFTCDMNELTSLKESPEEVGRVFSVVMNKLTSLSDGPKRVDGYYHCPGNNIKDLDGFDTIFGKKIIFGSSNPIGSLVDDVDRDFIDAFKIYKVIKGDEVNLKRLKYVMGVFDKSVKLEEIEKHYTIV